METRRRAHGIAFVRALAADPTAAMHDAAEATAADANTAETAAPADATSRLGALATAASQQTRKTKPASDAPEARRARANAVIDIAKRRRVEVARATGASAAAAVEEANAAHYRDLLLSFRSVTLSRKR